MIILLEVVWLFTLLVYIAMYSIEILSTFSALFLLQYIKVKQDSKKLVIYPLTTRGSEEKWL